MNTALAKSPPARALTARDLDAVIAIDAALSGRSRRDYFQRRLASAQRDAERHIQLAVEVDGAVGGFMLGRVLEGEFGRSEPQVRLEAFGVKPAAQHRGLGHALSSAFEAEAARRGIAEIRTTALWRQHELLRFLDRAGYSLAESHVLDCALAGAELGSRGEAPAEVAPRIADANDYSPVLNADFAPLARDLAHVALLTKGDLEGIARIDRRHTGRDRHGYLCRTFEESLQNSALRVSLVAQADGAIAGFVMARLDYGDFGRAEPVAVIDAIGVDPLRAHHGIGRSLLSQLFVNLGALGVERVETVVASGSLDLLGFFQDVGFRPAERLAFLKRL